MRLASSFACRPSLLCTHASQTQPSRHVVSAAPHRVTWPCPTVSHGGTSCQLSLGRTVSHGVNTTPHCFTFVSPPHTLSDRVIVSHRGTSSCHRVSLSHIVSHCVTLSRCHVVTHVFTLFHIMSHCVTLCHIVSLCVIVCHCVSLCVSHCVTLCHLFSITVSFISIR